MKKTLTILLLLVTIQSQASKLGEVILTTIFTGAPTTIMYAHLWYDKFESPNGLYLQPSLDARMIKDGLVDFKAYTVLKLGRWQPYLAWEVFNHPVNFEAYTAGLDYRIIDRRPFLDIGYETGVIHNQGKRVWTNALCFEVGFTTKYSYSISYRGDIQTRPEISAGIRYNGRVTLFIPL